MSLLRTLWCTEFPCSRRHKSFWMHEGIHFSATTLKPPAYYCVSPPCAAETVLTRRGMNRGPLRVSNCVWHWDVGACGLQGVGSVDQACSGANAWSDWDLGSLEAKSMPWALCHVPRVALEQFFHCGGMHCPTGGGRCHWGVPLPCSNA